MCRNQSAAAIRIFVCECAKSAAFEQQQSNLSDWPLQIQSRRRSRRGPESVEVHERKFVLPSSLGSRCVFPCAEQGNRSFEGTDTCACLREPYVWLTRRTLSTFLYSPLFHPTIFASSKRWDNLSLKLNWFYLHTHIAGRTISASLVPPCSGDWGRPVDLYVLSR